MTARPDEDAAGIGADGARGAAGEPGTGEEAMPDLSGLPLAELVRPGNAVLERAIRLARARRAGAGIVYAGFNSATLRPYSPMDEFHDDEDARSDV